MKKDVRYFNEKLQNLWHEILVSNISEENFRLTSDNLKALEKELEESKEISVIDREDYKRRCGWASMFIGCSFAFLKNNVDVLYTDMLADFTEEPREITRFLNKENEKAFAYKLKAYNELLKASKNADYYTNEYKELWAKVVDPQTTEKDLDDIASRAEEIRSEAITSGVLSIDEKKQLRQNKAYLATIIRVVKTIKKGKLEDDRVEFMESMVESASQGDYNKYIGNNPQAQMNLATMFFVTFPREIEKYKEEKQNNANKEPVAEKSVSDMFVTDINKPKEASVEKAAVEVNITKPEPVSKMFETGINKPKETSIQEKQAAEVNIQKPEPEKTLDLESEKSIFIELSLRLDGIWEMFLRDSLVEEDYAAIVANAKQASTECDKYKDRIHQTYYDGFTNTAKAQKILADILHKLGEGQFSNGELDTLHHNLDAIKNFLMKIPVGVSEGNRNALIDKIIEIQQKIERNEIKAGSNPIEMEQTYENIRKVWRNLLESYNDSQYYSDMQRSINVARTECYENPGITDEDKRAFEQIFQLQSYYADANAKFFDRGMDYYSLQHLINQFREIGEYIEHSETGMTRNQLDEIYYVINNRINQIRARMEEESSFGGRGGGRY